MLTGEGSDGDRLRLLDPLLGEWVARGESPLGPYTCRRRFSRVLRRTHVQLDTYWEYAADTFDERTIFAPHEDFGLQFWSFSSNGEQSNGHLTAAGGLSEQAVVFEALTPSGRMRMSYWPTGTNDVVVFVVDTKSRSGWSRLLEHHYRPIGS